MKYGHIIPLLATVMSSLIISCSTSRSSQENDKYSEWIFGDTWARHISVDSTMIADYQRDYPSHRMVLKRNLDLFAEFVASPKRSFQIEFEICYTPSGDIVYSELLNLKEDRYIKSRLKRILIGISKYEMGRKNDAPPIECSDISIKFEKAKNIIR